MHLARGTRKEHWCDCPSGPQPVIAPVAPALTNRFSVARNQVDKPTIFFPGDAEGLIEEANLALKHLSEIRYTFWKPIEIPIDLTVVVSTK